MSSVPTERSKIAHAIRVLAVPIVLGWLALTVITNVFVPVAGEGGRGAHRVDERPRRAVVHAMQRIGANFQEFDSDSNAMVILEGESRSAPKPITTTTELIKSSRPTPRTSSTSRTSGAIR